MNLNKDELLKKKTVGELLDLCIKLNNDNEDLRKKIAALQKEKVSNAVKETNKILRKENAEMKKILEKIQSSFPAIQEEKPQGKVTK